MNYTIRKATPEDVRLALALASRVFLEYIAPSFSSVGAENFRRDCIENEVYINRLISSDNLMFVAFDEDRIIGMVSERDNGEILLLFIDGDYHRNGIATRLTERMVCELKQRGFDKITLDATAYALPFYTGFGFIPTDKEQDHYGCIVTPMVYTPNEIWDIYDENRNPTGRYIERGRPLSDGDFHLAAFMYVLRGDGRLLVTKRSPNKKTFPNMWEFPHGAVLAGESTLDAAIREAFEECGLTLNRENAVHIDTYKSGNLISDHFLFRQNFDITDVVLQEGETCDAKTVTIDELRIMVESGEIQKHFLDELSKPGIIIN